MNRDGFALLTTLWLLGLLSVLAGGILTLAHIERGAAINRVAVERGRWAAEACLALAGARQAEGKLGARIDSVDLGGGLTCRAEIEDLGGRVAVTPVSAEILARLIGDSSRTAALLDWIDPDDVPRLDGAEGEWYRTAGQRRPRNAPLASLEELHMIRGFDSVIVGRLKPFLTVRGVARVNPNVAPAEVLGALPGIEAGAARLLIERRERGARYSDLDDLLAALPSNLRAQGMERYGELAATLSFEPDRLEIRAEGRVPESQLVTRLTVIAVPTTHRLALLTREEW